jgi:transposase InsO family protein
MRIRSNYVREFENSSFEKFCNQHGIKHEFSSPITPQQNGVVERKNKVIHGSGHDQCQGLSSILLKRICQH